MTGSSETKQPAPRARVATIQIGNTDNRLSQKEWSEFAMRAREAIQRTVHRVHFSGGADWDAPRQNACWVCEVLPDQLPGLKAALRRLCVEHRQESIALSVGEPEFITAE